jgi:DNA polymerase I
VHRFLEHFREVWLCDFEFNSQPGERPNPVCLVALEMRKGKKRRLWRDQFEPEPPFKTDRDTLLVAYYATAELGCFRSLGWPMPERILDLFTEFRTLTNGLPTVGGNSLLGALAHFGLSGIGAEEKHQMRDLILRGGPWSKEERDGILDYCETDVDALARLLPAIAPRIGNLAQALYRGRNMAAIAAMEFYGVPVNKPLLGRLKENWDSIKKHRLVGRIDPGHEVYDENGAFKHDRFERLLVHNNITWPRLESGRLDLSDDTFRERSKAFPLMAPLRELRHALSEMRLNDLAVGSDSRNRCMLSPFRARSGRNAPSNTRFIFGTSVWLRNLIEPPPDHGLAYIDWVQQEFGIAAVMSGDQAMLAAYQSGDCYLAFAKQAGAVPGNATKKSHPLERELFKTCILGTQYGMEAESLALRINRPVIEARHLLQCHREIYARFWKWSDNTVDYAVLYGQQQTVFGWVNRIPPAFNPRSLRNFHMQANGAEMLRLACCLGIENGIEICAPVHDAVLICAPLWRLGEDVERMRGFMAKASQVVLGGFELQTEVAQVIKYPDHYCDQRGERMWLEVMALL